MSNCNKLHSVLYRVADYIKLDARHGSEAEFGPLDPSLLQFILTLILELALSLHKSALDRLSRGHLLIMGTVTSMQI